MTRNTWVLAAAVWASGSALAAGTVDVAYIEADRFADTGFAVFERERNLQVLSAHLVQLGSRLPDGQTLRLQILDVDLAGHVYPRGAQDVRVLKGGADWPSVRLRYALQSEGRTLREGEARVSDMNYFFAPRTGGLGTGALPYERRMLAAWFDDTFAVGRDGRSNRP